MVCCLPSKKTARWLQDDGDDDDGRRHEKRAPAGQLRSDLPRSTTMYADNDSLEARATALDELRQLLDEHKIDIYVVPSEDEHLSEYPSPADRRLRFLTGFSGSAGTALVTRSAASLYVDSRYWTQAPQQVSEAWSVKRVGDGKQANWAADLLAVRLASLPSRMSRRPDRLTLPPSVPCSLCSRLTR
jgi:hypothetical protein